jgi:hypothetical protein
MSLHYVWMNGEVVTVTDDEKDFRPYAFHQCVDTAFPSNSASRYGKYNSKGQWTPILYSDLSPEFKTHLLLLGVS